jgi:hypothetical protein
LAGSLAHFGNLVFNLNEVDLATSAFNELEGLAIDLDDRLLLGWALLGMDE